MDNKDNKLAIEKTLEEAKKKVDIKFAVNLSTKYLSSQEKIDELAELLARCPSNIIILFYIEFYFIHYDRLSI